MAGWCSWSSGKKTSAFRYNLCTRCPFRMCDRNWNRSVSNFRDRSNSCPGSTSFSSRSESAGRGTHPLFRAIHSIRTLHWQAREKSRRLPGRRPKPRSRVAGGDISRGKHRSRIDCGRGGPWLCLRIRRVVVGGKCGYRLIYPGKYDRAEDLVACSKERLEDGRRLSGSEIQSV